MKILVGSPMRRVEDVECHREVLRWVWEDDGKNYVRCMLATPQGADAARSQLIEEAKHWGAQVLIMVDSDITVGLPFAMALSFARQAFSRGYAMVISPTSSFNKKLLVWPKAGVFPNDTYPTPMDLPSGLSEIGWGGLGLAYFDGEYLSKLQPVETKEDINTKRGYPMYCVQSPRMGEDCDLCRNVRESTGRKIGCDTRLATNHWKLDKRPSWPGAQVAQAILNEGAALGGS